MPTLSRAELEVVPGVVCANRLGAMDAGGNVFEPSELRTAAWDRRLPAAQTGITAERRESGVAGDRFLVRAVANRSGRGRR